MSKADWDIASSKIARARSVSQRDLSSSAYLLQA
uniref:Pre-mRNA-splicing factor CLF1-like n=1 Tax=Rhizophora mucronata TaxID=61149 RepID=A0A2P2KMC5_RHIMU